MVDAPSFFKLMLVICRRFSSYVRRRVLFFCVCGRGLFWINGGFAGWERGRVALHLNKLAIFHSTLAWDRVS
jgi:hypothetical protein